MPDYPPEWVAAVTRALSAIERVPSELPHNQGGQLSDAHILLDHLVPLIQKGTVEQVNTVLKDAGIEQELRLAYGHVALVSLQKPYPFTEKIDVRGLGNPDPYRLNQRSFMLATNEGSVPGADMGGIPASDPGIDAVAEFKIDRLLEQLCAEALRRFDRANTEGDPRREPLAQIANVLNAVREARA